MFELVLVVYRTLYVLCCCFSSIDVVSFGPLDWLRAALGLNLCCN
jgi:hypothetical protein